MTSLERHAEINLGAGEVFYTPRQPDGKLFILKQGQGPHLQDGRLQESSPWRWWTQGRSSGRWPSLLMP